MSRRNEVEIALSLQDRMSQPLKQAGGNLQKFQNNVRQMALPLTLIGGTAVAVGAKLVSVASDAEELRNKFDVTFGRATPKAMAELEAFGEEVGRGSLSLQRMAADTGAVIKSAGLMEDQAATLSVNLTKLATDVASFTNANDADVLNAFTRALTGEREALKTYGISINQAQVDAKALELGITDIGAAMSSADKAMVTYQLLLEKTSDSQGDAAKTSESLANQLKNLEGTTEDVSAKLGKRLMPLVTDAAKDLNDLLDTADRTSDRLQWFQRSILKLTDTVGVHNEVTERMRSELGLTSRAIERNPFPKLTDDIEDTTGAVKSFSALEDKRAKDAENYQQILAQSQVAQSEYTRSIYENIQAYTDQAKAAQAAIEAIQIQEEFTRKLTDLEFSQWLEDVDAGIAQMVNDIRVLNPLAFQTNDLIESAERILRQYEKGLVNAAEAENLLQSALQIIRGEIENQNTALVEQIALMEERIKQQERLTGRQLLQPGGFTGTQGQLESVFSGFVQNAVRRGGTELEGGGVEIGGRVITLDNFADLVEQLAQGGMVSGNALIEALRRLERLAGFQHGGVVPGPLGAPQLAMVHGGETILPTHKSGGGAGMTIVNHFHIQGSILSERDFMGRVKREIVNTVRGGGFRGVIERR